MSIECTGRNGMVEIHTGVRSAAVLEGEIEGGGKYAMRLRTQGGITNE